MPTDARGVLAVMGPPGEWSGAVASIVSPEQRQDLLRVWRSMSAEERNAVTAKWREHFNEPEDKTAHITLRKLADKPPDVDQHARYPKEIAVGTARGALAGIAGGALSAPFAHGGKLTPFPQLGRIAVNQAGLGAAAGAALGTILEAGKLQGRIEQAATEGRPHTLHPLDHAVATGTRAVLGTNLKDTILRGVAAGGTLGAGYALHMGRGTPALNRLKLLGHGAALGASKGGLVGVGLGAIRDIGRRGGRREEILRSLSEREKSAEADAEHKGLAPGDIIVMSMRKKPDDEPAAASVFRQATVAGQGGLTHAAIYVGGGKVVEAREQGVMLQPAEVSLAEKSYVALRPRVSMKERRAAAQYAKEQVGKPFDMPGLGRIAVSFVLPGKLRARWDQHVSGSADAEKRFTCSRLVDAAYGKAALTELHGTVAPSDFRAAKTVDLVKRVVRTESDMRRPILGRLRSAPMLGEATKAAALPISKERREAARRADVHFRSDDPKKWDTLMDNVQRKSFVAAVKQDTRADPKFERHVDQMGRLLTGKAIGKVGQYDIVRMRGGGTGCTCPDWRYKKSVAGAGEQDCKHIVEFKATRGAKTAAFSPTAAKRVFAGGTALGLGALAVGLHRNAKSTQFTPSQKQMYSLAMHEVAGLGMLASPYAASLASSGAEALSRRPGRVGVAARAAHSVLEPLSHAMHGGAGHSTVLPHANELLGLGLLVRPSMQELHHLSAHTSKHGGVLGSLR